MVTLMAMFVCLPEKERAVRAGMCGRVRLVGFDRLW